MLVSADPALLTLCLVGGLAGGGGCPIPAGMELPPITVIPTMAVVILPIMGIPIRGWQLRLLERHHNAKENS